MWKILLLLLVVQVTIDDSLDAWTGRRRVVRAKNAVSKIKKVDLTNNRITELQSKIFLQLGLLELQTIRLNNNLISSITVTSFSGLSQLEWLDLSHNNLTSIPTDTFLHNYNLITLSLTGNKFFQLPEFGEFIYSKSLKFLDISNCNIQKITKRVFIDIENVNHLNLSHNSIAMIEQGTFAKLKQLTSLDISFNNLTSVSDDIFPDNCRLCTPDVCKEPSEDFTQLVVDGNPWECDRLKEMFLFSINSGFNLHFNCDGISWDCLEYSNCSSTTTQATSMMIISSENRMNGNIDQLNLNTPTKINDELQHSSFPFEIIIVVVVSNLVVIVVVVVIFFLLRNRLRCTSLGNGTSEEQNTGQEMRPLNQNLGTNNEEPTRS